MCDNTAPERPSVLVGETCPVSFSIKGKLDSGDLGTGTPTVTEVTTSDLTITSKAHNTSTITIGSDTAVLAGQAVTCLVSGQLLANTPYCVKITFTTTGGATRSGFGWFDVAEN